MSIWLLKTEITNSKKSVSLSFGNFPVWLLPKAKVPASLFDFNLPIAPSTTLAFAPNINAEFSSVKPPRAISFALKSSAKTDVAISGVIIFSEPKLKEFSGAKK